MDKQQFIDMVNKYYDEMSIEDFKKDLESAGLEVEITSPNKGEVLLEEVDNFTLNIETPKTSRYDLGYPKNTNKWNLDLSHLEDAS